jgi:hypothetical protein
MTEPSASYRKRGRSPGYPAIDLGAAIERARQVFRAEGRNSAPVNAALADWGYSPGSGAGNVTLAALKKFGLLQEEGSGTQRRVRLTDEAFRIVTDEREVSPERDDLVRLAALKPKIYGELFSLYNGRLPSDATMRTDLRQRGFTERALDEFIPEFKRTLAFAGLTEYDSQDANEPDTHTIGVGMAVSTGTARPVTPILGSRGVRALNLPLSPEDWAVLHVPQRMTEREWDQMMMVLNAMKPGIITEERDLPEHAENDN